jgi:hypothetical protein
MVRAAHLPSLQVGEELAKRNAEIPLRERTQAAATAESTIRYCQWTFVVVIAVLSLLSFRLVCQPLRIFTRSYRVRPSWPRPFPLEPFDTLLQPGLGVVRDLELRLRAVVSETSRWRLASTQR